MEFNAFILPLPEKGDLEGECEWYYKLYGIYNWIKKMGLPEDFVVIPHDLLREYFTRFRPDFPFYAFYNPIPYYNLGASCTFIELSSGSDKSDRFENIRRRVAAEGPDGQRK